MKYQQRARSSANIFYNKKQLKNKFEAYGCNQDSEVIDNWKVYNVLLMDDSGNHKMLKVCVPTGNCSISFCIEDNSELCGDRVLKLII